MTVLASAHSIRKCKSSMTFLCQSHIISCVIWLALSWFSPTCSRSPSLTQPAAYQSGKQDQNSHLDRGGTRRFPGSQRSFGQGYTPLSHPHPDAPISDTSDMEHSSNKGLAVSGIQTHTSQKHLTPHETRYTTFDQELLAVDSGQKCVFLIPCLVLCMLTSNLI